MSVQPIPVAHLRAIFPRTNAHVLADILIAQGELSRLQLAARDREPTAYEDSRWSVAEDQIETCRAELRAMVARDTGIDCDALLAALS